MFLFFKVHGLNFEGRPEILLDFDICLGEFIVLDGG